MSEEECRHSKVRRHNRADEYWWECEECGSRFILETELFRSRYDWSNTIQSLKNRLKQEQSLKANLATINVELQSQLDKKMSEFEKPLIKKNDDLQNSLSQTQGKWMKERQRNNTLSVEKQELQKVVDDLMNHLGESDRKLKYVTELLETFVQRAVQGANACSGKNDIDTVPLDRFVDELKQYGDEIQLPSKVIDEARKRKGIPQFLNNKLDPDVQRVPCSGMKNAAPTDEDTQFLPRSKADWVDIIETAFQNIIEKIPNTTLIEDIATRVWNAPSKLEDSGKRLCPQCNTLQEGWPDKWCNISKEGTSYVCFACYSQHVEAGG